MACQNIRFNLVNAEKSHSSAFIAILPGATMQQAALQRISHPTGLKKEGFYLP